MEGIWTSQLAPDQVIANVGLEVQTPSRTCAGNVIGPKAMREIVSGRKVLTGFYSNTG